MKFNLFNITLFFLTINAFSQTEKKPVIGIIPLKYLRLEDSTFASSINEIITDEFVKSNKFIIVDRTKFDLVKNERELQKSEDFINAEIVEQGKTFGAEYILTGTLNYITNNSSFTTQAYNYIYTSRILVSAKILDVKTGEIISAETLGKAKENVFNFGNNCVAEGIGSTGVDALSKAMAGLSCSVRQWLKKTFQFEIPVLKIEEERGKKAKTILVAAGKATGLRKGQTLGIFEIETFNINGESKTRKKQIGIVEVLNNEDDNFATCNVVEGQITVYDRLINKIPLIIK